MRYLANACFAFAAGVFAAQYLLPHWLECYAAAGCLILGVLWALTLRGVNRRRAAVIGTALALALVSGSILLITTDRKQAEAPR